MLLLVALIAGVVPGQATIHVPADHSTIAAAIAAAANGDTIVIAAGTYWFVQRVFFPTGA